MITKFQKGQLVAICGCTQALEDKWLDAINEACDFYQINTVIRRSAFISNVLHESNRLRAVIENLNYSEQALISTWPTRFNKSNAKNYARQPQKIANSAYSNRMGNGNEESGDGWKYRGRGLIQCTGKDNYTAFGKSIGVDTVKNPELLEQPKYAALSAAWFWDSRNLNVYADRGEFQTIVKRINGGYIGMPDREKLYVNSLIVMGGWNK